MLWTCAHRCGEIGKSCSPMAGFRSGRYILHFLPQEFQKRLCFSAQWTMPWVDYVEATPQRFGIQNLHGHQLAAAHLARYRHLREERETKPPLDHSFRGLDT